MSIFASHFTKIVSPPSDPSATITLQKLSGRHLELAQAKHAEGVFDGFNGRGWANRFLQRITAGIATEPEVQQVIADPLAGYDRLSVVRCSIQSWSYRENDGKQPKPITTEAVADIDDETLEFLAIEIMRLTKPQLFQTPAQQEDERKNV